MFSSINKKRSEYVFPDKHKNIIIATQRLHKEEPLSYCLGGKQMPQRLYGKRKPQRPKFTKRNILIIMVSDYLAY